MRNILLLFIVSLSFSSLALGQAQADALLLQAMSASKEANYTAIGKLPYDQEGVYSRFVGADRVLKKIVVSKSNGDHVTTVVQNADGVFALLNGQAAELSWSSALTMWDDLFRTIHPDELKLLNFSIKDKIYAGRDCYEITAVLPESRIDQLPNIVKLLPRNWREQRPMTRVFMVDKETLVILRRQHFNADGAISGDLGYESIDFAAKLSADSFLVETHVSGGKISTLEMAQTKSAKEDTYTGMRWYNLLLSGKGIIYSAIIITTLFLVGIAVAYYYSNKNNKIAGSK